MRTTTTNSAIHDALTGAISGFTATIPMSAFMLATYEMLPEAERYALQPRLITERIGEEVGLSLPQNETTINAASAAMHFGYGTSVGTLYPLFESHMNADPVVTGTFYGLGVYAASYLGWLPATGIMAFGLKHPRRRLAMIVAAHVVWGISLGAMYNRLSNRK